MAIKKPNLNNYQAVLFDLDGTLLDSIEDLADSMNRTLREFGFPEHPVKDYNYFVGDGIEELAMRVLPSGHQDEKTIKECIRRMRQEYQGRWKVKTRPYPGIPDLLDALTERSIQLTVLSNKPDDFTKLMVSHFLSRWNFHIVAGQRPDVPIKPHPEGALRIAKQIDIAPEKFLYLGDTSTDMKTAVAAGMYPVGVLWGFREADELIENGAELLIEKPMDLL